MQSSIRIGNVENYYPMDGRVDSTLLRMGKLRSLGTLLTWDNNAI